MTTVLVIYGVALLIAGLVWFFLAPAHENHSVFWWAVQVHKARRARAGEVNDQLAAADERLPRPLDDLDRRGPD